MKPEEPHPTHPEISHAGIYIMKICALSLHSFWKSGFGSQRSLLLGPIFLLWAHQTRPPLTVSRARNWYSRPTYSMSGLCLSFSCVAMSTTDPQIQRSDSIFFSRSSFLFPHENAKAFQSRTEASASYPYGTARHYRRGVRMLANRFGSCAACIENAASASATVFNLQSRVFSPR